MPSREETRHFNLRRTDLHAHTHSQSQRSWSQSTPQVIVRTQDQIISLAEEMTPSALLFHILDASPNKCYQHMDTFDSKTVHAGVRWPPWAARHLFLSLPRRAKGSIAVKTAPVAHPPHSRTPWFSPPSTREALKLLQDIQGKEDQQDLW